MKDTTATALRAIFVLVSVSLCIAIIPTLSLSLLLDLIDGTAYLPGRHTIIAILALAIMLTLRWFVAQAFHDASAGATYDCMKPDPLRERTFARRCPLLCGVGQSSRQLLSCLTVRHDQLAFTRPVTV
jgi:hypothetical protein